MLEVQHLHDALIVRVTGVVDPLRLARMIESLHDEARLVILDLSQLTLVDQAIGVRLGDALGSSVVDHQLRVVCTHLGTGRLLRARGLPDVVSICATVEDALAEIQPRVSDHPTSWNRRLAARRVAQES